MSCFFSEIYESFIAMATVRGAPAAQGAAGRAEPARTAGSFQDQRARRFADVSRTAYSSSHTLSMDQNDPNGAASRFFTLLLNTEKMSPSWTKTMGAASTIFA